MVLGALLDLGLPLDGLRAALGSLAVEYGEVRVERVLRAGVAASKFRLIEHGEAPEPVTVQHDHHQHPDHAHHDHHHHDQHRQVREHHHDHAHGGGAGHHHRRSLKEIAACIERSSLSRAGKDRAIHLFERLGEAEAAIHHSTLDKVHLHEVGALDSIIDIVGSVHGMEWLQATAIVASPLNVGSGTVTCEHGEFPVPAPATARLLAGVPVYAGPVRGEMVTPTGALLISSYAGSYGPMPLMRLEAIGYGAGDRDVKNHPNVLRIFIGESSQDRSEEIVVLECEIDDMNPQLFGPLMDRLYEAGALDVYYAAVQMKKNRPGTLVTVLASPAGREKLASILFAETTTIGVRYQTVTRECLDREMETVQTPLGPIRFKIARRDGRVVNASPEFDDCARAAAEHRVAIKDVQAVAMKAWLDGKSS
jgi:pyridinium-3,5-bisthiocarboxylic acid mononucleotide nickel chelatase